MLKMMAVALTAAFVAASPSANAQQAPQMPGAGARMNMTDVERLTDLRIQIVRAALQLTPEQEQYWPAVENAIRARAKNRLTRIMAAVERVDEMRDRSTLELLRDRDPVAFMQRRAVSLTQRGADLKTLADAWQPLYKSLNPDQRLRMTALSVMVLREIGHTIEQRRSQIDDEDDDM